MKRGITISTGMKALRRRDGAHRQVVEEAEERPGPVAAFQQVSDEVNHAALLFVPIARMSRP
jgi:hypothetical protein